ncbi:MAG TPA: 4Fe-4S dicluster domain-containing protein, partial [Candidatus Methanoperedens sp.]|nr:4Fe-4S dicluster domain-containing protein [Candidatus Methanoperedens sp.]
LQDFTRRHLLPLVASPRTTAWEGRRVKYLLLAFLLAAAAAGWQAAWFLDPFSILARGFSVAAIPLANAATNALFNTVYFQVPVLRPVSEPVFTLLKGSVLTFEQQHFRWAWLSLGTLLAVLLLEIWQPRFWCRNLCPLGALLSLVARLRRLGRRVSAACTDCGNCHGTCPVGLIAAGNHRRSQAECTACMLCPPVCPEGAIGFSFAGAGARPEAPLDLSRRRLIGAAVAGLAAVPLTRIHPARAVTPPQRLRPPGARAEAAFLDRCLRCGACMKVCMRNAIHPALHEAGWEGLFTPVMDFDLGYCEYNCTLCGQVCPSEAIRRLPVEEKRKVVIGLAVVDKDRCIPYRLGQNCIVCEEHCPVPAKAIVFDETPAQNAAGVSFVLKRPVVVAERCIGCGICQTKCPVKAPAAIVVTPYLESRAAAGGADGYG